MQLKLVVLALLLGFTFAVSAQTYHPLLLPGRTWDIGFAAYGAAGAPTCTHSGAYRNYLSGDTIVNGKVYHKLYQQAYTSSTGAGPDVFCPPYYFPSPFTGQASGSPQLLVREDTATKKLYKLNLHTWPNPGIEDVLFDFSLQPADTFVVTNFGQPVFTNTIFAIDTIITANSQPRRRFRFGAIGMPELYFIEGVGGTSGFNEPVPPFEWNSDLLCVRDAVGAVEFSGDYCNFVLSRKLEVEAKPAITLSPNPASEIVVVKVGTTLPSQELRVEVLDHHGRQLLTQTLNNSEAQVKVSPLPGGIYLIRLSSKQKVIFSERLVVIR